MRYSQASPGDTRLRDGHGPLSLFREDQADRWYLWQDDFHRALDSLCLL